MVKKFENMFTRFDRIDERGRQTDTQQDTARRHRPRLCIALCGNKINGSVNRDLNQIITGFVPH